ncbi:MAG: hypothetical protein L0Z62_00940 [Gemmataceae bacterium]|nr:hypothetical protein [Gemmataceae bacterium]
MTRAYVFVEGSAEAELLQQLLTPDVRKDVRFVPADDASYLLSLARSVLVRRRKPVAVVMDSHSLNPDVIQERRQSTEELLKAAAGDVPATVIVVVPEVEVLFFASAEVLEKVLREKVPQELVSLGHRDPVGVLEVLSARKHRKWDTSKALDALDAQDMERMRAAPAVRELSTFLQNLPADDGAE